MRVGLVPFVLLVVACSETPVRTPSGRTGTTTQTATCAEAGVTRCSGAQVQACTGGRWARMRTCTSTETCGQVEGGGADCIGRIPPCQMTGTCQAGTRCGADDECQSRSCGPDQTCLESSCANRVQDGAETGPDCGGACPRCFGEVCSAAEQCVTAYCRMGRCSEPSCTDSERNGRETGVDCGGTCRPCEPGSDCRVPDDCTTRVCTGGRCAEPPASCTDTRRNGTETDVDCGGGACPPCANTRGCSAPLDCLSGWCDLGICARPTCMDRAKNQDETDIDCGGASCAPCVPGKSCSMGRDCAGGRCEMGTCASCGDGRQSGAERGVDCGGPCRGCADGTACGAPGDCESGRCEDAQCASCRDRRKTGRESAVDCGGPCPGCATGVACNSRDDCLSSRCEDGVCSTCNDNRRSGNESDVDCGGSCPDRCGQGQRCAMAMDCEIPGQRAACEMGMCCAANACGACSALPTEVCDGVDNDCNGRTDEGALCPDTTCGEMGACSSGACRYTQKAGARTSFCRPTPTTNNGHCRNGLCDTYIVMATCSPRWNGGMCYLNWFDARPQSLVPYPQCSGNSLVLSMTTISCCGGCARYQPYPNSYPNDYDYVCYD